MGPRIKRSIAEGFRAANRSWLGIGFFAAGLAAVTVLSIGLILATKPPPELFEEPVEPAAALPTIDLMESAFAQEPEGAASPEEPAAQPEETPAATEPAPAMEPAAQPAGEPEAAGTAPAPFDAGEANLFEELEGADEFTLPEPNAAPPDVTADDARVRVIGQWFGRAWPLLLIALLLAAAGNVWLSGGQISYLAKQVSAQRAPVSEFWVAGSRAFLPLIGAWALSLAVAAAVVGVLALVAALLAILPEAARAVLGTLVAVGLLIGFVWLVVRLSFWFIAIVVEGVGPIAGLKASFRASRGRWWRLTGLGLLMVLLSYVASLPFALLGWLGSRIGGGAGVALGLAGNVGGILMSLYVGFVMLAAYLRFYADTKAVPSGVSPATP